MLQAQGKIAEAADAYAMGVEREPDDADVYYDLGQILFSIGLYELAIAAFDVTAELEADFPDISPDAHENGEAAGRSRRKTTEPYYVPRRHDRPHRQAEAIAKAVARNKPKAEVPLVLEWQQKGPERPFSFSRNAMPTAGAVKTSGQKGLKAGRESAPATHAGLITAAGPVQALSRPAASAVARRITRPVQARRQFR